MNHTLLLTPNALINSATDRLSPIQTGLVVQIFLGAWKIFVSFFQLEIKGCSVNT